MSQNGTQDIMNQYITNQVIMSQVMDMVMKQNILITNMPQKKCLDPIQP